MTDHIYPGMADLIWAFDHGTRAEAKAAKRKADKWTADLIASPHFKSGDAILVPNEDTAQTGVYERLTFDRKS